MSKVRHIGTAVTTQDGEVIIEPRASLIDKFASNDLLTYEGRKRALSDIARICIEGYYIETAVQKTASAIQVLQRNPDCAVRAIQAIHRLEMEQPQEGVTYTVNIGMINPTVL